MVRKRRGPRGPRGPYYNTTGLTGDELIRRGIMAGTQDYEIYCWFREHPEERFTRDEIHELVLPDAQNTSIGRALNTLMNKGLVMKLDKFRMGNMGAKQHLWELM